MQASTKFSPHMLLTSCTPRFKVDNSLKPLVQAFEKDDDSTAMVKQMVHKLQLITKIHAEVINNVGQA